MHGWSREPAAAKPGPPISQAHAVVTGKPPAEHSLPPEETRGSESPTGAGNMAEAPQSRMLAADVWEETGEDGEHEHFTQMPAGPGTKMPQPVL